VFRMLDYCAGNPRSESRFGFSPVISGEPPIHTAVMGTCVAGRQRDLPWL